MLSIFWEQHALARSLYGDCLEDVCKTHGMTRMEMDILLFLANNPRYDTAADMVEIRQLAKSHVSMAVKTLTERGMLTRHYKSGNRKTVHLRLTKKADPIVQDGKKAQEKFVSILYAGFSGEEVQQCRELFCKIRENIRDYYVLSESHHA